MELFSRRRWRLVSAQVSNKFGYCPPLFWHIINSSLPVTTWANMSLHLPVSCHAHRSIYLHCFSLWLVSFSIFECLNHFFFNCHIFSFHRINIFVLFSVGSVVLYLPHMKIFQKNHSLAEILWLGRDREQLKIVLPKKHSC